MLHCPIRIPSTHRGCSKSCRWGIAGTRRDHLCTLWVESRVRGCWWIVSIGVCAGGPSVSRGCVVVRIERGVNRANSNNSLLQSASTYRGSTCQRCTRRGRRRDRFGSRTGTPWRCTAGSWGCRRSRWGLAGRQGNQHNSHNNKIGCVDSVSVGCVDSMLTAVCMCRKNIRVRELGQETRARLRKRVSRLLHSSQQNSVEQQSSQNGVLSHWCAFLFEWDI